MPEIGRVERDFVVELCLRRQLKPQNPFDEHFRKVEVTAQCGGSSTCSSPGDKYFGLSSLIGCWIHRIPIAGRQCSFGELDESAQTRRQLLAILLPRVILSKAFLLSNDKPFRLPPPRLPRFCPGQERCRGNATLVEWGRVIRRIHVAVDLPWIEG